jgi:hypothetical protein
MTGYSKAVLYPRQLFCTLFPEWIAERDGGIIGGIMGASATLVRMRPNNLGRALGIGARLLGQRVLPAPPPAPTAAEQRAAAQGRVRKGQVLGQRTRNVGRGGRNLGRAVWNPFAHASSILWLEITGMFFALFAVLFAQHLWAIRRAYRSGSEHTHFIAYGVFSLLFLYFAASSFARARTRSRRRVRERAGR